MAETIKTVPLGTPAPAAQQSNVKETIEQILVAFILAFIFRCFIVEAFVIPTGSMAPTLLGAHMDFRCPDCGWNWEVNYSGPPDNIPLQAGETYNIRCPNCAYKLPRIDPANPANDATQPPVQYGDRILVQKYIYLAHEPRRWDVVVFKNPALPIEGAERFQDNYIKRLTGLPGETLMILDGDIYTSTSTAPIDQLKPEDFTVQTKPHKAQEALWRIVYDNDHHPRGLPRVSPSPGPGLSGIDDPAWQLPWVANGDGWNLTQSRTFTFDHAGTGQLDFDRNVQRKIHPLTDWLGYDISAGVHDGTREGGQRKDFFDSDYYGALNNVSDVKLALTYRRHTGDGPLRLKLTKQDHTFIAELTPEKARLLVLRPGESTPVALREAPLSGDRQRIEFTNVDYRVALRVNGSELLATTPDEFRPDVKRLLEDFDVRRGQLAADVAIEASAQRCEVTHVSLWRDVYYLNADMGGLRWGIPTNFPAGNNGSRLVRLGPDDFFTMGDNSMLSGDARGWDSPVYLPYERLDVEAGRVPRRFMLGRAFFVYWPAGHSPTSAIPFGFLPNFGEMRFIH